MRRPRGLRLVRDRAPAGVDIAGGEYGYDAHCGPAIHIHAALVLRQLRHLEYFHDHVRIEKLLFDDLPQLREGGVVPDLDRPGRGWS